MREMVFSVSSRLALYPSQYYTLYNTNLQKCGFVINNYLTTLMRLFLKFLADMLMYNMQLLILSPFLSKVLTELVFIIINVLGNIANLASNIL